MHPRARIPDELLLLAAHREGVLTRTELLDAGISRHAITRLATDWQTLGPGVFAADPGADPWLAKVHAGVLLGGDGSAACGATAAALWGLLERPATVEILTPSNRRTSQPWLIFHRRTEQHRRIIHLAPARVSLEDAVIDAGDRAQKHDALALVARALQERRTTPERLRATVRTRSRLRHRALLQAAIGDSAAGAHSALEQLFMQGVQRPHRLSSLVRQYVVPETGHPADLAAPDHMLLIELDGVRYHDPTADQTLDNRHTALGYRTLRFTWTDIITSPCTVALTIFLALRLAPTSCMHCR